MNDTQKILAALKQEFPDAKSELNFDNPYQLLVAVVLSAQCTDKRVNQVTPALFAEAPTPQDLANMSQERLQQLIHSCGFFRTKAQHLHELAVDLVEKFDGRVPSTIEELQTLSGVGRKTANVVYAVGFGGQAIAVDTHVFRVANRVGLATADNVEDTERQLMVAIPQNMWTDSHHYLLLHGRYVCKSQHPKCDVCPLQSLCRYYAEYVATQFFGANKSKQKSAAKIAK